MLRPLRHFLDPSSRHKICFHFLKILLLSLSILLFVIVWLELTIQQETHHANILLERKVDEMSVELKECRFQKCTKANDGFHAEMKPSIPAAIKKKMAGFKHHKLVHIDLKGAPPKHPYLLKLLPILKSLGATGILLEYEDMFPYKGSIRELASKNAYSSAEIIEILSTAESLKLEVIPLVQTFGHLEFVLKHEQFYHLRETFEYPNLPCPLHEGTRQVILQMLDQVLALHPSITQIHVGGDEIFNMKECGKCKTSEMSKEALYIHHMAPVLRYIRSKTNSRVKPIIWDDMMRNWSVENMRKLSSLTDVMVWGYGPSLENYFPADMWERYNKAFPLVWLASSFKGALSANNNIPPILMHLKNHESWLKIVAKLQNKISGIAITGWSRYDHFATLCELMPVSLPSLGLSLCILREGSLKAHSKDLVKSQLGFLQPIVIEKDPFSSWEMSTPGFEGGTVHALAAELENHVSWYKDNKNRLDCWSNDRQVEENVVNLFHVNAVEESVKQLIPSFATFRKKCYDVLREYYFEATAEEWVRDKVDPYVELSKALQERLIEVKRRLKVEL